MSFASRLLAPIGKRVAARAGARTMHVTARRAPVVALGRAAVVRGVRAPAALGGVQRRRVAARARARHVSRARARARAQAPAFCPPASAGGVRHLNLHEYQSKELLESHGARVQKGRMAETAEGAYEAAKWILKESACVRACEGRGVHPRVSPPFTRSHACVRARGAACIRV